MSSWDKIQNYTQICFVQHIELYVANICSGDCFVPHSSFRCSPECPYKNTCPCVFRSSGPGSIICVQAFLICWALIYVWCVTMCVGAEIQDLLPLLRSQHFAHSAHTHMHTHTGFQPSITFSFHRFKVPVKWGLYQQPVAYLCGLALSCAAADSLVEEMALSCIAVLKVA